MRTPPLKIAAIASAILVILIGLTLAGPTACRAWQHEQRGEPTVPPGAAVLVGSVMIIVGAGAWALFASRYMRWPRPTGRCPSCGYCRQGRAAARCPECGLPW